MKLDELKEHCLKTLKHTVRFPTKTFEEHALVLRLIENQTSVIAELEKIKAEAEELIEHCDSDYDFEEIYGIKLVVGIIDKHINKADCDNDCEHCEWTECPKD